MYTEYRWFYLFLLLHSLIRESIGQFSNEVKREKKSDVVDDIFSWSCGDYQGSGENKINVFLIYYKTFHFSYF